MTSLFSQHLWDKTASVIKHSQTRIAQTQQFTLLLSKRIQAQQAYSESLSKLAQLTPTFKPTPQNPSPYIFTFFKQDCSNRSFQTKKFSKSLKEQILLPLKQLISLQTQETKQIQKKYKSLERKLHELQQNILKISNKFTSYYNENEETLMLGEIFLSSKKHDLEKKAKVISKQKELLKNLTEMENSYHKGATDYNNFIAQYYWDIDQLLDNLQKQERVRLSREDQNIMRTLVLSTSMYKNIEYDISNITKQSQKMKGVDVIDLLTTSLKTGKARFKHINKHLGKTTVAESILKITNSSMEKKIELEKSEKVQSYVGRKFGREGEEEKGGKGLDIFGGEVGEGLEEMFNVIDKILSAEGSEERWKSLKLMLLKCQHNRLVLWMYLKKFGVLQTGIPSQQKFSLLAKTISLFLDVCHELQDVFIARTLTNLTFIIHHLHNNKKLYLCTLTKNNKIYSFLSYWKASIFESIQETIKGNFKENSLLEHNQMSLGSLVWSQLAMFCHQMVMVGMNGGEVKQMMGMFCRLYEIEEREREELMAAIEVSVRNYEKIVEEEKRIEAWMRKAEEEREKQKHELKKEKSIMKQEVKQENKLKEISHCHIIIQKSIFDNNQQISEIAQKISSQAAKQPQCTEKQSTNSI